MSIRTRRQDADEQLSRLVSLGEPIRRRLYRYVAAQGDPVSREQAAAALDLPVHIARFHLERLEADGLLTSVYRRPPGRSGPGAGRPAKHYQRTERDITVTIPARHYDLLAGIMAHAIQTAGAGEMSHALRVAAEQAGRQVARDAAPSQPDRPVRQALVDIVDVLDEHGFEPRGSHDCITLANCPFHRLAAEFPDLVCAMNLEFVRGLVTEAGGGQDLTAVLEPAAGRCCVLLRHFH